MDATELSEQIKTHLSTGDYSAAHYELIQAWNEAADFGRVYCDVPEFTGTFVKFKTRGYPFALRQQWEESTEQNFVTSTVLSYITEWNLADVNGQPIDLPAGERSPRLIDNLEDGLVVWLVGAFRRFWRITLLAPRKNSSPPSPTA
jgi:hypothetical protein